MNLNALDVMMYKWGNFEPVCEFSFNCNIDNFGFPLKQEKLEFLDCY